MRVVGRTMKRISIVAGRGKKLYRRRRQNNRWHRLGSIHFVLNETNEAAYIG